jgi:anaerobic dimethyl sulfoxide reductase subunit C (anchor subunit)
MKERSLVAFTLLTQTAVGGFLSLLLARAWLSTQLDLGSVNTFTNITLIGIGLLVLGSLFVSTLHLGSPLSAWRAIGNLRTSWLSREIAFFLLFGLLGGLYTALHWFQFDAPQVLNLLACLTALSGLALVYSMAKIYHLRTVTTWVAARPLGSFLLTTLLLGGLFCGAALTLIGTSLTGQRAVDLVSALTVPVYGLGILSLILISADSLYILKFSARVPLMRGYLHPPDPHPTRLKRLSLILLFLGAACILSLLLGAFDTGRANLVFLAAFGLVGAAELCQRILFYDSRRPEM